MEWFCNILNTRSVTSDIQTERNESVYAYHKFTRMIVEPVLNGTLMMKTMGLKKGGPEPIIILGFWTAGKFENSRKSERSPIVLRLSASHLSAIWF